MLRSSARKTNTWKGIVLVLLIVMVTLNFRILLNTNSTERENTDLRSFEDCDNPPLLGTMGANITLLNATHAWFQWVNLSPNHTKVLGYRRPNKGFLTIGVPSIKRINGMNYLLETLSSLIERTSNRDKMETVVLVFLADFDRDYNNRAVKAITEKYMDYVNQGFIQVVQVSKEFYPELSNLKMNFNDKSQRVSWRAKQVADFSFMFLYSRNMSEYYVQIEDDVICAEDFVPAIRSFIQQQKHPWAVLYFSELGFIGKLFKSKDLLKLSQYMMTFYDEQPIDWLINYFRFSMAQRNIYLRKPTLFQHVGLKSSFDTSKDNKLKDRFFDTGQKRWRSDDPPGTVITSMKSFNQWIPDMAYGSGSGFFWAMDPKQGDTVNVIFDEPQMLKRVGVETGTNGQSKDILEHGLVESSPKMLRIDTQHNTVTCADYRVLGNFTDGMCDVDNVQERLHNRKTKCLKVTITKPQETWIVFQQIAVFVSDSKTR